jgi:hypothetical protein
LAPNRNKTMDISNEQTGLGSQMENKNGKTKNGSFS